MLSGLAAASTIMTMAVSLMIPGQIEPAVTTDTVVRFNFDATSQDQVDGVVWQDGCFDGMGTKPARACVRSAGNGVLSQIERPGWDGNLALEFPAPGTRGRTVLEIGEAAAFNPGEADFSVSATVALHPGKPMPNLNIVQKGYFDTEGGQWKLQADLGLPTCRISGIRDGKKVSAMARAEHAIAGAGWVSLRCERKDGELSMIVNETGRVTSSDDAAMDISNHEPVRIGGKDTSRTNDQWHGSVDDVSIRIAP